MNTCPDCGVDAYSLSGHCWACDDAEIARLRGILREIWGICHVPSGSRHAYTHFQADFDRIRALTKPFAEDAL